MLHLLHHKLTNLYMYDWHHVVVEKWLVGGHIFLHLDKCKWIISSNKPYLFMSLKKLYTTGIILTPTLKETAIGMVKLPYPNAAGAGAGGAGAMTSCSIM